jgi:ribosomal protein S18 acetylase RimI-like enzyme
VSGITFHEATLGDVNAMARLRDESGWEGGAAADRMARYLAGEHYPQHAKAARVAYLAKRDDMLIGYIAGHLTSRFGCEGEVQWILVAPADRGSPAAEGLLRRLAEWLLSHDARRVCVNVEPDNQPARHFYHRLGAVELSAYWLVWHDIAQVIQ